MSRRDGASSASGRQPWYRRWYAPGLFAVLISLAVIVLEVYLQASFDTIPVAGLVSIVLSFLLFSLGWTLDQHRSKIEQRIHREISAQERALRSDVARIGADVEEPYLLYLRDQILDQVRRPLWELEDRGRALVTVEQCTDQLIRAIGRLEERGYKEILAVCGQKDWDSPQTRQYYEANYEQARRGVKVKRIFLQEPGRIFSDGERAVLGEHLAPERPNVEAKVIFGDDFRHLQDYRFPPGFGFAILGNTVIVHWGLGRNLPEAGRELTDPWFVDVHRKIFWRLWNQVAQGGNPAADERIFEEILESHPPPSSPLPRTPDRSL